MDQAMVANIIMLNARGQSATSDAGKKDNSENSKGVELAVPERRDGLKSICETVKGFAHCIRFI